MKRLVLFLVLYFQLWHFGRWNSPIVQDWHVTSIPAFYLLDSDLQILLRPNSVRHIDAWVDWNLVQGNR